jgi:hypothetical protein
MMPSDLYPEDQGSDTTDLSEEFKQMDYRIHRPKLPHAQSEASAIAAGQGTRYYAVVTAVSDTVIGKATVSIYGNGLKEVATSSEEIEVGEYFYHLVPDDILEVSRNAQGQWYTVNLVGTGLYKIETKLANGKYRGKRYRVVIDVSVLTTVNPITDDQVLMSNYYYFFNYTEVNGGPSLTVGDIIIGFRCGVVNGINQNYGAVIAGSSGNTGVVECKIFDKLGGGKYLAYLVTGTVTDSGAANLALPEGMTIASTYVYFYNRDEDGNTNTNLLKIGAYVSGVVRGFSEGGIAIVWGESVNENLTSPQEIKTGSFSYTADPTTWIRDLHSTSGPMFGGIPFKLTTTARMYKETGLQGSVPVHSININRMDRELTIGAAGRFYQVSAETKTLLVKLPDFDFSDPSTYSRTAHKEAWFLNADGTKWVRATHGEVTLVMMRRNGSVLQQASVTLHGYFDHTNPSWTTITESKDALESLVIECTDDDEISATPTNVTGLLKLIPA